MPICGRPAAPGAAMPYESLCAGSGRLRPGSSRRSLRAFRHPRPYLSMRIESRTACSFARASGECGERFWVTNTWRWLPTSNV